MNIENRHIELIAKSLAGELTSTQQDLFNFLLDSDEAFKSEYEKLKAITFESKYTKTNEEIDVLYQDLLQNIKESQTNPPSRKIKRRIKYLWLKSAVAAACIGVSVFLLNNNSNSSESDTAILTNQELKKIVLPDSTTIVLNRHSKLTWDSLNYNVNSRTVFLDGEGFFDVSKNKALPFIVKTKYTQIKVLGTAFNVKSFTDKDNHVHFETELIRGKIELSINSKKGNIYLLPKEKVVIEKNQNVVLSKKHVMPSEIKKDTAWLQNEFIWDNETLEQIAKDIENRFNVIIVLKDPTLNQYRFSGDISADNLESVLKSLSMVRPFKYVMDKNKITISK